MTRVVLRPPALVVDASIGSQGDRTFGLLNASLRLHGLRAYTREAVVPGELMLCSLKLGGRELVHVHAIPLDLLPWWSGEWESEPLSVPEGMVLSAIVARAYSTKHPTTVHLAFLATLGDA